MSLAYQLNDSDQSCGYYADASAVNHGFYRDANGTIHAPVDLTGSTGTILFGNNNANIIVGRYSDGAGATHGIVFVPPRKFIVYDYPGSTFTSLNGINTANEICGRYIDSAGIEHGLLAKLVRGSADGNTRELPLAASGSTVVRSLEVREADVAPAY